MKYSVKLELSKVSGICYIGNEEYHGSALDMIFDRLPYGSCVKIDFEFDAPLIDNSKWTINNVVVTIRQVGDYWFMYDETKLATLYSWMTEIQMANVLEKDKYEQVRGS